ncbi:MAG TPA: PKD domain-containing protein [Actinomycetota bacterium]
MPTRRRRPLRGIALLAAAASVALSPWVVPPAGAISPPAKTECDPPAGADQFCVRFQYTFPDPLNAADPVGLDLSATNTSQNASGAGAKEAAWIDHLRLQLLFTVSPMRVTPSQLMPAGLLVAGGDNDCAPGADGSGYASCDAGHGTVLLRLSGSPLGVFDGFTSAPFGITKIVNVHDADPDTNTAYDLHLSYCVPAPSGCSSTDTAVLHATGRPGDSLTAPSITVPTMFQRTGVACGAACTVDVDGSPGSFSLRTSGLSNALEGGPADRTYTIMSLPRHCGTAGGGALFTSHGPVAGQASASTVSFLLQPPVDHCPVARFRRTIHGSTVDFDGSSSFSPVTGRTVTRWAWNFDDGSAPVTLVGTASHPFPPAPKTPPSYDVRLTVTDSAGAVSDPVVVTVRGTATTLSLSKTADHRKIRAAGKVLPWHAGRQILVQLFRRKAGGTFAQVATATRTLSSTSGYAVLFPRPDPGTCRVVARFGGDVDHIGSRVAKLTPC